MAARYVLDNAQQAQQHKDDHDGHDQTHNAVRSTHSSVLRGSAVEHSPCRKTPSPDPAGNCRHALRLDPTGVLRPAEGPTQTRFPGRPAFEVHFGTYEVADRVSDMQTARVATRRARLSLLPDVLHGRLLIKLPPTHAGIVGRCGRQSSRWRGSSVLRRSGRTGVAPRQKRHEGQLLRGADV